MAAIVTNTVIFDFSKNPDTRNWVVVNDGVMGGQSKGNFVLSDKSAIFSGAVSLENNGGFSMVRKNTGEIDVSGYSILELHLKGDGKKYQVRIREKNSDYFSYIKTFQTSGNWENVQISLGEMYPSLRGRKLDLPNYRGKTLVELSFLIGNKKEETFRLELQKAVLKQRT